MWLRQAGTGGKMQAMAGQGVGFVVQLASHAALLVAQAVFESGVPAQLAQ